MVMSWLEGLTKKNLLRGRRLSKLKFRKKYPGGRIGKDGDGSGCLFIKEGAQVMIPIPGNFRIKKMVSTLMGLGFPWFWREEGHRRNFFQRRIWWRSGPGIPLDIRGLKRVEKRELRFLEKWRYLPTGWKLRWCCDRNQTERPQHGLLNEMLIIRKKNLSGRKYRAAPHGLYPLKDKNHETVVRKSAFFNWILIPIFLPRWVSFWNHRRSSWTAIRLSGLCGLQGFSFRNQGKKTIRPWSLGYRSAAP